MSKLRSINTRIWSDTWFEELSTIQKLLFIYFITNEKNNMLGVYEISLKKVAFETGINLKDITTSLKVFTKANKIKYVENRVILLNYLKHQKYNLNMMVSAVNIYNDLPKCLKLNNINTLENTKQGFETLCNGFGMVRKVEVEDEVEKEDEIKEYKEIKKYKNPNSVLSDFKKSLQQYLPEYGSVLLNDFYLYWTEKKPNGKKMLFEMQKTFDIKRRLTRWHKNDFNKNNKDEKANRINQLATAIRENSTERY